MEYKYDVTFSFAGEDRSYVEKVATILSDRGVKVFYDKFEEDDLWGKDLGIHFDTIYRKSAKYCIPFVSRYYKEKVWTNYELRNVLSRAIEQNGEYILPARFDDTEIEGIRPTLGFIDLRNRSEEEFANLILKKLNKEMTTPISETFQEKTSGVLSMRFMDSFHTGSFGVESLGGVIEVTITNKLTGPYRYFYEPVFRLTKPFEGKSDTFQLYTSKQALKFPVKLEYGEEMSINYPIGNQQLPVWQQLDEECEVYSTTSTTVGERFDSNTKTKKELIELST